MAAYGAEDAIVKSITVRCNLETAFRIWTEHMTAWWPEGHTLSGRSDVELFIEDKAGGRFYERTSDGTEYDWGQVILWEPPHRLAYYWYLGSGPERPSRVDVQFTAQSDASTQVQVVHRGPEHLGEQWPARSPGFESSWQTVLASYVAFLGSGF